MKSFVVSWYADGYIGTFNYLVVADDIETAKEIWAEFVKNNNQIAYFLPRIRNVLAVYAPFLGFDRGL